MTAPQKNTSIESESRSPLPQTSWGQIEEPGAYVELGSGDLYRFPKESLIPGASPMVVKESEGASRLLQISKDPFVTNLEARLTCARHNVQPNF